MSDQKQTHLYVVRPSEEELEKKREFRRRVRRILLIAAAVAAGVIIAFFLLIHNVSYVDYNTAEEMERSDTSATRYVAFGDGYVKYSNDGASYITIKNDTVWNQSYEMENPMVTVCDSYIAFADRGGGTVYVLNKEGLQGEISLVMPILRIDVASQGTIAVLTTDSGTGYLSLFDKAGGQIAEGAIHVENTGTPLDIALSDDGKNLAVAIVDVSTGTARTTINFYNFGTAGQNHIDNLVGSFQYSDTVIPEVEYAGDSTLTAFADNGVYVFEGSDSPEETGRLEAEGEIYGIFYGDSYFGLVYSGSAQGSGREICVYDMNCRERLVFDTDFSYDSICFLDNNEICLLSSDRCDIYTLSGKLKFSHEFGNEIESVFHWRGYRGYIILEEGVTERVRLKIFGNLFSGTRNEEEQAYENIEDTAAVNGIVGIDYGDEVTEEIEEIE